MSRFSKLGDRVKQRARDLVGPERRADAVRGRPAEEIQAAVLKQAAQELATATPRPGLLPTPERPEPPTGARNYVLVVLDSLRFDSLMAAAPRVLPRLGPIERRYSYATWTAPSHYNLLMGLLPHPSPTHVFASTWYKQDFLRFGERLGVPGLDFAGMIPRLWMPDHLRNQLGYHTRALVSMPVLNPHTPINVAFDSYALAERQNDLSAMIDAMHFDPDRPTFWLLNTGEAHYPYALPSEPEADWPRIHGLNGVFQQVSAGHALRQEYAPRFFDQDRLDALRQRQVEAAAYLDGVMEKLLDCVPPGTWVTITSDHGELFGEGGWFGHGPIHHEKVLEVPLVEGLA